MATKSRTANVTKYLAEGSSTLLVSIHETESDGWMLQDFRSGSEVTTNYYETREEAEAYADALFGIEAATPTQLYRITRMSVGYEEVDSVLIAADDEQEARLLTVKHYRSMSYVAEFLFEDEAEARHLGTAAEGIAVGTVLMEAKSPA